MISLLHVLVGSSLAVPRAQPMYSAPSAPPAGDWTALEVPALCSPQRASAHPDVLSDGSHLRLRPRGNDEARPAPPPWLPQALVAQILEDDARARGHKLEFLRSSPALIARGPDEALASARALLRDIAAQSQRLEIELGLELVGR